MMKTIFLALLGFSSILAEEFTATEIFTIDDGGISKEATCDVAIFYSGSVVDWGSSTVDCTCKWPRNKKLDYTKTLSFTLGDLSSGIIKVTVDIKLSKGKNKPSGTLTTAITSTTELEVQADMDFNPTILWCPAEDYYIWGNGTYDSIVNEAPADGYEQCAQRCAEYVNDNGNAPCFSWVINNNDVETQGLAPKTCRLLAYMNVNGVAATGVQSGYHKCWNAMLTSVSPP